MAKKIGRIFLDASVVVSATLSPDGGSAVIFGLASKGIIQLVLTERVFREARLGIKRKYNEQRLADLYTLLVPYRDSIKPTPTQKEQQRFLELIEDPHDCHVLAGAVKHKVEFLITLDKKHFLTEKLEKANLGFSICTPGMFLSEFREQSNTDR